MDDEEIIRKRQSRLRKWATETDRMIAATTKYRFDWLRQLERDEKYDSNGQRKQWTKTRESRWSETSQDETIKTRQAEKNWVRQAETIRDKWQR